LKNAELTRDDKPRCSTYTYNVISDSGGVSYQAVYSRL